LPDHFEPSITGAPAVSDCGPETGLKAYVRYLRPCCPHEGSTRGLDHRPLILLLLYDPLKSFRKSPEPSLGFRIGLGFSIELDPKNWFPFREILGNYNFLNIIRCL